MLTDVQTPFLWIPLVPSRCSSPSRPASFRTPGSADPGRGKRGSGLLPTSHRDDELRAGSIGYPGPRTRERRPTGVTHACNRESTKSTRAGSRVIGGNPHGRLNPGDWQTPRLASCLDSAQGIPHLVSSPVDNSVRKGDPEWTRGSAGEDGGAGERQGTARPPRPILVFGHDGGHHDAEAEDASPGAPLAPRRGRPARSRPASPPRADACSPSPQSKFSPRGVGTTTTALWNFMV